MICGLTGGIACGKTTVAQMLARKGAFIVDADQVARDVVAPKSVGLLEVVDEFGEVILKNDELDREALGAIIFADPSRRKTLEAILHPLIAVESARQIQTALSGSSPMVVYDAALLVESGRADDFRPLIVVAASPDTQVERIVLRDGLNLDAARARLNAQMPIADKAAVADYVLSNDGSRDDLQQQVDQLWRTLIAA